MDNQTVELKKEVTDLVVQANGYKIKTQEEFNGTADFLKTIKGLQKKIKECFDPIVSKAKATHTEACNKRSEHLEPTLKAEKIIKQKMIVYSTAIEAAREKEKDRLRLIAIEKERKEKERLEKRAEKAEEKGQTEKADALREQKEDVYVAPAAPETVHETPKGVSFREVWSAEVIDKGQIPIEWLVPNQLALDAHARSTKGQIPIKGVRFNMKKIAAGRS
ncbi:MAG: hypothetical protein HQ579_07560 [Candidatus Omnitrophica bacterium]|nr:hypothetical protein [Candidatus Omnitrophota bacterium]